MKKKFIKTPLKGVYVHGAKDVGTRTVNLLMGEHAGEYVRGDIMDANAVIQAFDELKGNVDNDHDSLEEVVDELHNLRDATDQSFEVFQEKAEKETADRIQGDKTLDEKIDQKERESKERDNVLQQNIDTEKQERVNADTQLRNDLTAEVNRAKARENALDSDIQAEATKRENDDNTIKDNLNAEVTRATAKENEIKAEVDVINGDSTTEGSFRKAIADVVGAAPEAYDTLKEIADKLNENDDLHTAINDAIATKATTVALNEEITRAKAAEAENKAEIAAEAARAKKVEGDNALAIQNEVSRATTAETAINEAVNTEAERAKGQEAYLQNLINTKADTTALEGAKTELDKKISDEIIRATNVEATKASADDLAAEIARANQSEATIINDVTEKLAQKADTTTLNEQVDTLNAAISAKQDKPDDGNMFLQVKHDSTSGYFKREGELKFTHDDNDSYYTSISPSGIFCWNKNSSINFLRITSDGITLDGGQGTSGYAFTTNGETKYIPTSVSQLTNDSNFITADDIDFTPYATIEALTAVEQKVTANTTAIANVTVSKGIPYDPSVTGTYQTDKNFGIKLNDANTALFGPSSFIGIKSGDYTFSVNPGGIKQVGSYKFDVNSSDGIKWSTTDDTSYSQMDASGLYTKIGSDSYTKCGSATGLDIKGYGPYNGTQTTLNPDQLLMKKSDDRQITLNPDQLLMKSGGSQITLTPEQLLIQKDGIDNILRYNMRWLQVGSDGIGVKIGPLLFSNGGPGIEINSADNTTSSLQASKLYLSGVLDRVPRWVKLDLNGINFGGSSGGESGISKQNKMIYGFDVSLQNTIKSTLFDELVYIESYKQDKITPTTELDLTSIDTADIESLRSIVKSLATELNTLGLIKLKSAEETA